jgi:CHAT domain-containing protein
MVMARLLVILLLIIGPGIGSHAVAADSQLAVAGKTLLGQECSLQPHYAGPQDPQMPQLLDIHCGAAKLPSGSIQIIPWPAEEVTPEKRREIILSTTKNSSFTIANGMRMACFPGQWLSLDDTELLISSCTLRDSGWPAMSIAAWHDQKLFQADGPVAIFPILRDVIEAQHSDLTAEQNLDLLHQIETVFGSKIALTDGSETASFGELCDSARLQDTLGNYEQAEEDYRKALAIQQAALGAKNSALGETMMHLALEVSNQGRAEEARDLFKAAEPLIQNSVDPIDDARLISYLALDAANRHKFAEARDLARRATEARRALANGGSDAAPSFNKRSSHALINGYLARGEIVQSRLLEAAMSLRLDEVGEASAAAAEALEIAQTTPGIPSWWRAEAMSMMGEIEGRLGHSKMGETMLHESIAIDQRLFGEARPTALAWLGLGRFHANEGQYETALADFRQGLAMLSRLGRNESSVGFDSVATYFTTAIDVALHNPAQHDQILAELFVVMQCVQKGKETEISSRSFERLAESDPKVAEILRDLQDAERIRDQMRLSLAGEEAKAPSARDAAREQWLGDQYRAAAAMAAHLDQGLKQNVAEYRRLSHSGLASLSELQAVLKPGEVYVTFAFGEEFGLAFAASRTSVEARPLAISAVQLGEDIRELREGVIVRSGRVGRFDINLAYQLYRTLMLPIDASLSTATHLVVSSSGALASLPFAALVTQVPKNDTLTDAAWLIRKADISQMPLAAAFLALRTQVTPSKASRPFLGVGNPSFTGGENGMSAILSRCESDKPMSPDILAHLPPLPDTATEIQNVAAVVGADKQDLLLGADATETNFRARPLNQYRILYFATHGLLPAELRCQSEPALALTPPLQAPLSKAEDGLLEADEIAGLKLDADLVVLSACNTATASGKFGGDTLSSLSDVFFYAGSRGVLATHWPVPSASTVQLMSGLFENYAAAPSAGYAAALREAQLTVLGNPATSHPVHWAGFSLIGGATPSSGGDPATATKGG